MGKESLVEKINIPVLMATSDRDEVVNNLGAVEFCQNSAFCTSLSVPMAYHQAHLESDPIRDPLLKDLIEFFSLEN